MTTTPKLLSDDDIASMSRAYELGRIVPSAARQAALEQARDYSSLISALGHIRAIGLESDDTELQEALDEAFELPRGPERGRAIAEALVRFGGGR